jgi:uncharacterized protein YqgV (UPF0045/DUF77 family)
MFSAEVSIYPMNSVNSSSIINDSIKVLENANVDYKTGSVSTYIEGSKDAVFKSIKDIYDTALKSGEMNMVVTISNSKS